MSNVNGDLLDEGLQAVMGKDRCQNEWQPAKKKAAKQLEKDEAVDASWVPVRSESSMDKVKDCAKWALLFASVSGLLFYWQQAGLLASSAAVPSLIFCALGAGLAIGWHAR